MSDDAIPVLATCSGLTGLLATGTGHVVLLTIILFAATSVVFGWFTDAGYGM